MSNIEERLGHEFIEKLVLIMREFAGKGLSEELVLAALASMIRGCTLEDDQMRQDLVEFILNGIVDEEELMKEWKT
jgi:hypothetical protein